MSKRILVAAGVAIVFIGLAIYLVSGPSPMATSVKYGSPSLGAKLPLGGFMASTTAYQVATNYPTTTPLTGSANGTALGLMRDFVASTTDQFEAAATADTTKASPYTLAIAYLIGTSAHAISYVYTVNDYTGGTHSFSYFTTFTFDTKSGALLSLANLFNPGAAYLTALSTYAQANLPAIIGADADTATITAGTQPISDDFENFFLAGDDLVILFPPYQVASYADGPQTLPIPLSQLSGLLKSEYQ